MTDGTSGKAILMTQKAEHQYQSDYQNSYGSSDSSKWIWGTLAALAALAFIIWLAMYSGPSTGVVNNNTAAPTEQITPAPAAPAAEPAAPAADPAAPAQPPAAGGTQNP
jgi:hypothetical protein